MTLTIRKAESGDADALFALVRDFATSFKPERGGFEASLRQLLSDESALLLVAEIEARVVGYCLSFDHFTFYAGGRVSWVEEIMVRADMRREGVGKALMDQVEAWARSRESKLIALATRRAAPFYAALGYEESAIYFRKLFNS